MSEEEKKEETLEIPVRKVIYVDLDEEVTDIFNRIENLNFDEIYLVVPRRATLTQSVINLKILKSKLSKKKKKASIITSDPSGIRLAQNAGFAVFDKIDFSINKKDKKEKKVNLRPLTATSNTIEEDRPQKLEKKKIAISDIIKSKNTDSWDILKKLNKRKKRKVKSSSAPDKPMFGAPSRPFIILISSISLVVLLLIVYIVLPGTEIIMTPASAEVSHTMNVNLSTGSNRGGQLNNLLGGYTLDAPVEFTFDHKVAGELTQNNRASGTLTVFNSSGDDWTLIEGTRFQTTDGIVFRLQNGVVIPGGTSESPGTLDVFVIADENDAAGNIVGDRANISPTRLFLPGLRAESQDELWAENKEEFGGGDIAVKKVVTDDDIETARKRAAQMLEEKAEDELQNALQKRNSDLGTALTILQIEEMISVADPSISIDTSIIGESLESFEVSVSSNVQGYAFNKNELINLARFDIEDKSEFKIRDDIGKKLIKIYDDEIRFDLINQTSGNAKLTVTFKGIEQYDIDLSTDEGRSFTENIKERVLGWSIGDAENYIQQLPEVNRVKINNWPGWAPTLPKLSENIRMSISE